MKRDKINIRFIDLSQELNVIPCLFKKHTYIEQLLFELLENLSIGPVCRSLFGLRILDKPLWLAPNTKLSEVHSILANFGANKQPDNYFLDLRIRFIPSSITKLRVVDSIAFEMLFAQIRYDFLHSRFTAESKSHMLFNNDLMGLIATDVLRVSVERKTKTSHIYKTMNHKDFVPHKAPIWQRSLVFPLRKQLQLEESLSSLDTECPKTPCLLRQSYIEHFIRDVCTDYGAECYKIKGLHMPVNPQILMIRVKCRQTKDESSCTLEVRHMKRLSNWTFLCDLQSICYATLHYDIVELNIFCGKPYKISFISTLHAKSFLSLIDGYYRLMRKWHAIHFCKEVMSPDLENLNSLKCHGPIGLESVKVKLPSSKRPGTYLIRRCMNKNDKYVIDVLLRPKTRLHIDFVYSPKTEKYTIVGYNSSKTVSVKVETHYGDYSSIPDLIKDVQIVTITEDENASETVIQLLYLIVPSEYDDYPLLLLCMSKKNIKKMFDMRENRSSIKCLESLPKFIPPEMLEYDVESPPLISKNGTIVKFALLDDCQRVIVKELLIDTPSCSTDTRVSLNILHNKQKYQLGITDDLKPLKDRIIDWVILQNSLFADTIGLHIAGGSLIQEYLTNRLDLFLEKKDPSERILRTITNQLSHALIYLQEKQIVHGKLRCHNIFLKNEDPVKIKITDLLGYLDKVSDRAFIAPEYFRVDNNISLVDYEPGLDVWAFATTVWQIYSRGVQPTGEFANTFLRPDRCPVFIWNVLETCWEVVPHKRATPQTIYRGLNDALEREPIHDYDYLIDSENSKSRDHHFFWKDPASNGVSISVDSSSNQLETSTTTTTNNHLLNYSLIRARDYLKTIGNEGTNIYLNFKTKCKEFVNKQNYFNKEDDIYTENDTTFTDIDESRISLSEFSSTYQSTNAYHSLGASRSANQSPELPINESLDYDKEWQIDSRHVKLSIELGKGATGVVMKGVLLNWRGIDERVVAVKTVCRESEYEYRVQDLKREFSILKELDHENIVKTLGYVKGDNLQVVIEFVPLGSLLEYIKDQDHHSLPLQKYALDVAQGMEYLESKRVIHRDLALRNVLVKSPFEVKICDFGLAQTLQKSDYYQLRTQDRALPIYWFAPESLKNWKFSHKTDVWSYGILLWELYSGGANPINMCNVDRVLEKTVHQRLNTPDRCPDHMLQLMTNCWIYNPDNRFSFRQVREYLENH